MEQNGFDVPLRKYWRQINRRDREAQEESRAKQRARDSKRPSCRCVAYPWPHRPGGGLCRWPDPPVERYRRPKGERRPYRGRYAGLRRQLARASGLHPIRDRAAIEALMPGVITLARELKRQYPKVKYRNMQITATGVRGHWTTAGPTM